MEVLRAGLQNPNSKRPVSIALTMVTERNIDEIYITHVFR